MQWRLWRLKPALKILVKIIYSKQEIFKEIFTGGEILKRAGVNLHKCTRSLIESLSTMRIVPAEFNPRCCKKKLFNSDGSTILLSILSILCITFF